MVNDCLSFPPLSLKKIGGNPYRGNARRSSTDVKKKIIHNKQKAKKNHEITK